MPRLFIRDGTAQGLLRELDPGTTTIGRGRDCAITLESLGVSRRHAAVHLGPGGEAVIEDLGSKNGTLVNGTRIRRAVLGDGDEIAIGRATFVYRAAAQDEPAADEVAEPLVHTVLEVDPMRGDRKSVV